jgi:large subunit ribosomal protein L19
MAQLKGKALMDAITSKYIKEVPSFDAGDNVKVFVSIKEGSRERLQVFEGLVIKKQGGGVSQTFTVRKVSYGIGVERTFPTHSPSIDHIEVVRRGKVRRANLGYIRTLSAKASRIKEKRDK